MSADIGEEFDPLFAPHEKPALLLGRECEVIASIGHDKFVADVTGTVPEQNLEFTLMKRFIEIRRNRKLGCRWLQMGPLPDVRHGVTSW